MGFSGQAAVSWFEQDLAPQSHVDTEAPKCFVSVSVWLINERWRLDPVIVKEAIFWEVAGLDKVARVEGHDQIMMPCKERHYEMEECASCLSASCLTMRSLSLPVLS